MSLFHGRWRRRLSLFVLGALEERIRPELERHLAGCAACGADLDELRGTLALLARDPVRQAEPPLPVAVLAARVRARLDEQERPREAWRPTRAWALGAAAAAALAAAALWLRPPLRPVAAPAPAPSAAVAEAPEVPEEFLRRLERSVAREQAARYLDEAGDVLVTVAARPRRCRKGEERVDIGEEARRSRELLARQALVLDVDAEAVASARPVLDDVEQVLREVASLEACARKRELETINRQIERRRLLLKIDLMTRELVG